MVNLKTQVSEFGLAIYFKDGLLIILKQEKNE